MWWEAYRNLIRITFFLYSEQLRIAGRNLCSRAPGITGSVSVRSVGQTENELGMVMGFGCGMIILLNISLNFAGMFGWIPLTSTFLPFLSFGRNNILLCYALVGIILSIYRYKDVYPKKFKASQVSLQKTITLKLDM